ncbi:MAG: hypothetical protein HN936_02095 [Bacteroidetes bacterium]|jgi:hypothetical protein|nr:hypothetical protein [Bacteroidota bacterium]MBT7092008.1 hypothetical protein [Bacteroidota bacterium]MBT7466100.1 hypothetical protein [Bacteroidota bacterium]
MKTKRIVYVLLLAIVTSLSVEAKKVQLKYVLEEGMEFTFELVTSQDIAQEVMGQAQNSGTEISQVLAYKVLMVNADGNYRISMKINRLKMKTVSPMGDIEFNSDDMSEDDDAFKMIGWLWDEEIIFTMTPHGEVLEVEDVESLAKKSEDLVAEAGSGSQIYASLASQFGTEEAIKQNLSNQFFIFPESKVKVGKAWESVKETKQMISMKNTIQQTITEVTVDAITLTQQVKIDMGEGGEAMEVQGMEMQYELSGGKDAVYEIDPLTGLTITGEGHTTISGIISIESPQLPTPMSIPMTIKSTDKIVRLK